MHGGKSPKGFAHPNFKHGWYSNDLIYQVKRNVVRDYRRMKRLRERFEAQLAAEADEREARELAAVARRRVWSVEELRTLVERMAKLKPLP